MFGRSLGTAAAVSVVKGCMLAPSPYPLPRWGRGMKVADVGEPSGDGGGRRHGRAHEMRAGALALAPLEVAVGRRGDALVLARRVAVHPDAHGAAGLAPLEAGRHEDLVEAFCSARALVRPAPG